MVARVAGIFEEKLSDAIANSKILVVGAGGIGCEILKNLVLTGFPNIEIIDLDTIDVSNLNRQFLFRKEHVGKSKAQVARDTALTFNPNANIVAHHDTVISNDYSVSYFKSFNIVVNALDNRAARNHVNRMCLAADTPLIETGTAGYAGQVELIKKGMTQCYECQPKAPQKSFPGCTIRNTPSEPIHCIVWAKHLFNQLFGEEDPDQDVSPDTADPEAAGGAGAAAAAAEDGGTDGNVSRRSTRAWAALCRYDPEKLFTKFFHDDILYLLSMENLWKKRRPPTPLSYAELLAQGAQEATPAQAGLPDQRTWTVPECAKVFTASVRALQGQLGARTDGDHLVWDKDERGAMDFVTACANLRAHAFAIPTHSRFTIKSMAGNIIPAIASANAIVGGVAVLRCVSILRGHVQRCSTVYLRQKPTLSQQLVVPERALTPANPACYVCAAKREVALACNLHKLNVRDLDAALRQGLHMQAPDAAVEGRGSIVLSSEPGETDDNLDRTLHDLNLTDGTALIVDDFLQNYELRVRLIHDEDEPAWRLVRQGDEPLPAPEPAPAPASAENGNGSGSGAGGSNGSDAQPGPSRPRHDDSDSDMEIVEPDDELAGDEGDTPPPPKRRHRDAATPADEVVDLC